MRTRMVLYSLIPCLAFSTPLYADTAQSTFLVSVLVASTCVVAAIPLAFGVYQPTGPDVDITNTVTVTCTNLTPYAIGLNAGITPGATVSTRKMANGLNVLNYGLYQDAPRSVNWGNTVGVDTMAGNATGLPQVLTIYGRIPGSQTTVPTGLYTDTITITVTY